MSACPSRARPYEHQRYVHAAHERRHVERRQARLGGRRFTGAIFKKQLDDFESVLFASDVEGREPVQRSCVRIRVSI